MWKQRLFKLKVLKGKKCGTVNLNNDNYGIALKNVGIYIFHSQKACLAV